MSLDSETKKRVNSWLEGAYEEGVKKEIKTLLQEDPNSLVDAFYKTLAFGTGGLRGIMGLGTNRINVYTIRAATQGFSEALMKAFKGPIKVVISYDSRHNSRTFAEEAAKVFAGNGIEVLLFKELRPTPLASFACRYYQAEGAVMVTASHNPPEYNGYKVYWNDGAQVLPPNDEAIIDAVGGITSPEMVKSVKSLNSPLIQEIGEELDNAYLTACSKLQLYKQVNELKGGTLKIVYSNLHGTGITIVPKLLKSWGFTNLCSVATQELPDGSFKTVKSPNPEERQALEEGIALLQKEQGDILIAKDPDADRVGTAVLHQGQVVLISGNQMACILLEHICNAYPSLPKKAAFVKTLVTTPLFDKIAAYYKRPSFNVLTGFKYIAELIREWEESGSYEFLFGAEESYGYLLGTEARDKDAVITSALIAEAALYAKERGKTLVDLLNDLYSRHGVFVEKLASINFSAGKDGAVAMKQAMHNLRVHLPKEFNGNKVTTVDDYSEGTRLELSSGETRKLLQPESDMLILTLEEGTQLIVRPSGTEPKMKVYCNTQLPVGGSIDETKAACEKKAADLIDTLTSFLQSHPMR